MRTWPFLLKGWKPTLTGLLFFIVALISYTAWVQAGLDGKMPSLIGQRLKMDLTAEAAAKILHVAERNAKPTADEARRFESERQAIERVQIVSVTKRGLGGSVVAEVKFQVDGQRLPDRQDTRYYRLKFGWLTGWWVAQRTTEYSFRNGWL